MHVESFDFIFFVGQSAFFRVLQGKNGAHDDAFREMKVHISADRSPAARGAIIAEPEDFVGFFFAMFGTMCVFWVIKDFLFLCLLKENLRSLVNKT